jgi:hypothetical protein
MRLCGLVVARCLEGLYDWPRCRSFDVRMLCAWIVAQEAAWVWRAVCPEECVSRVLWTLSSCRVYVCTISSLGVLSSVQ